MNIRLSAKAAKSLKRMHEPEKGRIVKALRKLAANPPEGDIKSLAGQEGYRLRVGNFRVLFDRVDDEIIVYEIGQRGQVYKGGR